MANDTKKTVRPDRGVTIMLAAEVYDLLEAEVKRRGDPWTPTSVVRGLVVEGLKRK